MKKYAYHEKNLCITHDQPKKIADRAENER